MDALKRMVWLAVWLASLRLGRRESSISIGSFVAAHLRIVVVLLVSWFIASDSLYASEQSPGSNPYEIGIRIVWGHDMPRNYVGEIEAVQSSIKSAIQIGIDPHDSGLLPKDSKLSPIVSMARRNSLWLHLHAWWWIEFRETDYAWLPNKTIGFMHRTSLSHSK